ncbi:methyltransferase domain-containing protein (plasmid) [Streptomyces sp. PCS3-D2]|uniref:methyltransferase domain-containing protein n=1 Tax=Streptomyces sp. PCS3-D2 TaxID=1460244 RepID=UPI00044F6A6A|nr:methyltransferase domain-containing protein [Streptomyces sp. PCS3-D2]WKV76571.1 methyltransferase domain-containing protein [Streptomyces sp. PCS3-D2]
MTHATHHACGGDHPHGPGAASYPDFAWDDLYTGDGSDTADPDPALLAPADHLPPGRALDLGCGAGGNALALAERGWRVTAVDLAPRAIASTRASACARGLDGRIELAVADSASWQPESAYGFALSSYALPPRGPARTATLATLAAALAPGGVLAVGEWDEEACDWGDPGDLATLAELTEALTRLGLDIVRAERQRVPRLQHPSEDHAVIVTARKPHDTLDLAHRPITGRPAT